jgi:hypothetical protein
MRAVAIAHWVLSASIRASAVRLRSHPTPAVEERPCRPYRKRKLDLLGDGRRVEGYVICKRCESPSRRASVAPLFGLEENLALAEPFLRASHLSTIESSLFPHLEEKMKDCHGLQFFRLMTLDGETLVSGHHIQQIHPTGLLELSSGAELRNRHSLAVWKTAIEVAVKQGCPITDVIMIEQELMNKAERVPA